MRSHFFVFFLALASLLAPLSFGQQTAPEKERQAPQSDSDTVQEPINKDQGKVPTFRKNVNLVNVLFNVKDKHGALIPNLEKDRFELLEEGKPQTIKYFSALSDQPLTIGLLIDTSYSMNRTLPEEKVVAGGFLQKVLTPKDLAFVISFDVSVDLLQDLTNSSHLLRAGLDKAKINTNTKGMAPMGT